MSTFRKLYWLTFVLGFSVSAVAVAQGDCPTIVQQALTSASTACDATGRNQACYGNINLSAQPQTGVVNFSFTQPGDLVDVAGIQSLTLSPLDQAQDIWGVALMKLQANLPDTLPGQNVTFLLFGDVEIQNAVSSNVDDVGSSSTDSTTLNVTINTPSPLIESLTGDTNQNSADTQSGYNCDC